MQISFPLKEEKLLNKSSSICSRKPRSRSQVIQSGSFLKKKTGYKQTKSDLLNQIVQGDSIQMLKQLDSSYIFDLVIADPPYNIGKNFGNNKDNLNLNEYVKWSLKWIELCLNHLKEDGLIYIYGFSEILAHIAVHFPLEKQKWLVWHYTNKTVPSLKFWQRSHETLICLWKNKKPQLNVDQIREPYTSAYEKCIGKPRKATLSRFGAKETIYNGHERGALPRDVLRVPALAGGKGAKERTALKHPTQKPLALTEKLLKSKINESGGRVLIPFAGSGSECVMAKKLKIDFLGIEINPDYVKAGEKWLKHTS